MQQQTERKLVRQLLLSHGIQGAVATAIIRQLFTELAIAYVDSKVKKKKIKPYSVPIKSPEKPPNPYKRFVPFGVKTIQVAGRQQKVIPVKTSVKAKTVKKVSSPLKSPNKNRKS